MGRWGLRWLLGRGWGGSEGGDWGLWVAISGYLPLVSTQNDFWSHLFGPVERYETHPFRGTPLSVTMNVVRSYY